MKNHKFHPHILRKYDIRGTIGDTLSEEDAYYIGLSYATIILKNGINGRIAIGYDGRVSSPSLRTSLVKGINEAGISVVDIGLCATPELYFATTHLENIAGGIMITGSHNPSNQNGFKIIMDGKPFFDTDILKLRDIAESGLFLKKANDKMDELLTYQDISNAYIEMLIEMHPEIKDLKVIWDPGNGAVGAHLQNLLNRLKGEHKAINIEVDGTFPSHHPNPSDHKNLKQLIDTVLETKSDLGIAFDGDGDRLGVVDSKGNIITGDVLLLIMATDVLSRNPKSKIIADVKTSDIVFEEIKRMGGNPIIWKTGHSFIKTKMKEEAAILAGEMSGHIFFSENYYGFDDAIMAAVKLLSILSKDENAIAAALSAFNNTYSTPELAIECDESEKFKIIDIIKHNLKENSISFLDVDGVRVKDQNGWWLVRASNTEAKLILRVESHNKESLLKTLNNIKKLLGMAGINKNVLNTLNFNADH